MKIGLQFAMPAELHALPGAKELEPFETVSGVPFFEIAPNILACAGGVSKVNAAMAAEMEGGAVAQAASMSGVPFAVVRAISDLADGTAAASFEQFEQHAADVSAAAVLQALALLD